MATAFSSHRDRAILSRPTVSSSPPGQRLAARGDENRFRWIELHYELDDGTAWLHWHYLLPDNWVITMQEPRRTSGPVTEVADGIAEQMAAQLPA